ncbi:TraR/DksA C4-type zinc finger protein [Dendrosporobacter sp. 1207_IL3150]|uniref:TraR/DksA C4-type zinc finger protein n=1 Tax=Dendrosporobacter sp. 1207_IL3150 TaxID=3084054 RepID=UPI002FD93B7E
MNSKQLEQFKNDLEQEKKRLISQISRLEETGIGDSMSDSLGELSVYDNHPADIGDELFERSKDTALRDNEHIILENVERALEKIDDESYGHCDKCGKEISVERLEAIPWANTCMSCQQDMERADTTPRPIEEVVLEPAFHRTFLDSSRSDFVGFDGEDSLQAVLRYGSSDSPQDIPGSYNYKALFPNSNEHAGIVDWTDAIPAESGHQSTKKSKKAER